MNTFDLLTRELLHLKARLSDIPFLIGGGMGLYLRSEYHESERSPRYQRPVPTRSTKDLDVILSAEVIADADRMDQIREALSNLGYKATTPHFQFARELGDNGREVEIDLLAAPPRTDQEEQVKQSGIRARPHESEGIHGRVAEEARSVDRAPIPIDLSDAAKSLDIDVEDPTVLIPSSFNYLVLKLHAFRDRRDDKESDYGRHHAMDIFTTTTDMSREDWADAEAHFEEECEEDHIQTAIKIQQRFFSEVSDLGIVRIQENELYQRYGYEFDEYLPNIIEDLNELFSGC